eukprot:sb/3463192/
MNSMTNRPNEVDNQSELGKSRSIKSKSGKSRFGCLPAGKRSWKALGDIDTWCDPHTPGVYNPFGTCFGVLHDSTGLLLIIPGEPWTELGSEIWGVNCSHNLASGYQRRAFWPLLVKLERLLMVGKSRFDCLPVSNTKTNDMTKERVFRTNTKNRPNEVDNQSELGKSRSIKSKSGKSRFGCLPRKKYHDENWCWIGLHKIGNLLNAPGSSLTLAEMKVGTSKQPIRTRYLGHVTGYQPISDQYFLIRSSAAKKLKGKSTTSDWMWEDMSPADDDWMNWDNDQPDQFPDNDMNTQNHRKKYHDENWCWIGLHKIGNLLNAPGSSLTLAEMKVGTSKQPIRTRYLGHVTGYQPISDQYFLIRSTVFKQPIRTRYLGHVTGYQPISDQYFLIRSSAAKKLKGKSTTSDWMWEDMSPADDDWMNWDNDQPDQFPDNDMNTQNHVRMYKKGLWDDSFDYKTSPYACDYTGKYILVETKMTVSNAEQACAAAGLTLAKVRRYFMGTTCLAPPTISERTISQSESAKINDPPLLLIPLLTWRHSHLVRSPHICVGITPGVSVWIGVNDLAGQGYIHFDGEEIGFNIPWHRRQPDHAANDDFGAVFTN